MTPNPHDSLFKATFSQVEHVADLLRLILPPELVRLIDFTTLALCPGSFIDEVLKGRHADLLFSAQLSGPSGARTAFFYVLTEHQSTSDELMAFRLLRYEVRIWEGWLKENPTAKRLPPILPVVVHHSAEGWKASVSFEALLDVDTDVFLMIAPYVPRFQFLLDDISAESDEALRGRAMSALGRMVLWCLRNARTPEELARGFRGWAGLVGEVRRAPNGAAAMAMIIRYIFVVNDRFGSEELLGLLMEAVGEEEKEEMASVADQFIEQGRREGERKGRVEGLVEGQRTLLLRLLRARFGELPEAATARVNAADAAQLDVWADRVLSAPTLEDVLEDV